VTLHDNGNGDVIQSITVMIMLFNEWKCEINRFLFHGI